MWKSRNALTVTGCIQPVSPRVQDKVTGLTSKIQVPFSVLHITRCLQGTFTCRTLWNSLRNKL